jgi:signal transduction histidine kinase
MCSRVINNLREPHSSFFTPYGSYYVNSTSEFLSTASEDQRKLMRNTCHRFGYETLALIPIRSGELTMGLIHLADQEMNRLDGEKLEIIETAALQLGIAIDRVRAEQALKDANKQLEKRVADRTAMLSRAKNHLQTEVEKRRMYEQELLGLQQRLRELSSRLIQTEARERRRIASEIHDRIGQTLAVIKMQLGAIEAEFDIADLRSHIESIRKMVSQTIRDVRTLTFELSPPILYELGLKAALEWLAESVRKQSGLPVEVEIVGNDRVLDADGRVFLFRTCSELVVNVVKHADAKQASVKILIEEGRITARVVDDGIGFDPTILESGFDPSERGFGLFSIREQLTHYGGSHRIDSKPDWGSLVEIQLPLKRATQSTQEKAD